MPTRRLVTTGQFDLPRTAVAEEELWTADAGGRRRLAAVDDDPDLARVLERLSERLAERSLAAYRPFIAAWWGLCRRHGADLGDLPLFRGWIWAMAAPRIAWIDAGRSGPRGSEPGAAAATIRLAVAAASALQALLGRPAPTDDAPTRAWLRGSVLRRLAAPQRRAPALLAEDLAKAVALAAAQPGLRGLRDRALLLLGWTCALRRSELAAVRCEHLRAAATGGWELLVPRSKADRRREGRAIPIWPAQDAQLDALAAVEEWKRAAGIGDGPLFRRIRADGGVGDEALDPTSVYLVLRRYPVRPGLSPHSLRAGYVTSARLAGADLDQIAVVSRHRSLEMVRRYVRDIDARRQGPGSLV